jgi:hypothetical protein
VEQALLLGSVGNRMARYRRISGFEAVSAFGTGKVSAEDRRHFFGTLRRARRMEQRLALDAMSGRESGLSAETLTALAARSDHFDFEAHGSRLTALGSRRAMTAGKSLVLAPQVSKRSVLGYANRSEEAGWLWTRLMPHLQLKPGAFGAVWAERWRTLDDSFRFRLAGPGALGKPIGAAMLELVQVKFPFDPQSNYWE